ncbi:hypothetical protein MAR_012165 [Mya arenaria]|uniref:WSC domain-containing protein n=1 Tax=Mya arenaria TaxID=6604 RepID=A0ABY7G065_MYAAR|nr:hypothetical protein MAR_012165 [Mya arenaria]
MKLKEIAGIAFIMIFVLCSEANELCTRNHTVHDQHTIIIGEACEWNVKASDIFAKLFFTASRQENDAQSCGTGDSIEDTVCYCLDGMQAIVTMAKYCSFPCQENLREMCGGPNYLTIYSSDSITICQFLQTGSDALFTRTYAHCSTQRRNICQDGDELCGQTFVEHKGAYNFTAKPGIHECNWEISVEFDVAINVSAEMDTQSTLQTCLKHKLSVNKKIALYIPVTISVCLIVVVAIVVAICLRRKRGKKNARKNVDEYNYSYTTTEAQTIHLFNAEQSHPECKLGEYTEVYKPQLPGSAHNVNATGPDANNQEYHTLHQQLEPTYSDPQENVYNETVPPSTDDGQYDVSSVSPLSKKSAHKSHGLTDNVYNTSQSPNDTFGNYDVQYDVSSVSASSNECVKKSKGQTDNVYNTFKSPDDTEYSEANLFIKE